MKQGAASFGAGVGAGVFVLTASEAGEWIGLLERIRLSPAFPFLIGAIVLAGIGYIIHRQRVTSRECDARVELLMTAVQGMYAILATDDRYRDLPSFDDFAAGRFNIAAIHQSRSAPSFTRAP